MSSRHHIVILCVCLIFGKIEEGPKITDVAREFDIAQALFHGSRSPNLNPIENVWDALGKVAKGESPSSDKKYPHPCIEMGFASTAAG
ncbi:hypothetical protein TNCV_3754591 [Trichonephila clavipes]|nr:hypothetical protein TNCV_3754591 [Trichonephila clavipes]